MVRQLYSFNDMVLPLNTCSLSQSFPGIHNVNLSTSSGRWSIMARVGTPAFKKQVLEPNHLLIHEQRMSTEDWSKIAFSLGIPAADISKPNASAKKVAQKLHRRQQVNPKQLLDHIAPIILAARKDHYSICHRTYADFHVDAIPTIAFGTPAERGRSLKHSAAMKLLTVAPTMSFGYHPEAFSARHRELQAGLIPDLEGEPCDLSNVSEIVPDVFWPFLVVEMAADSMMAAQQRCAVAAAACNHALTILAKATYQMREGTNSHCLSSWDSTKATRSFSLAIHNKQAALYLHHVGSLSTYEMQLIKTYRLDNSQDMEALVARIQSILVWAEHCRLPAVLELLENFDRRVNGSFRQQRYYEGKSPASKPSEKDNRSGSPSGSSESSTKKPRGRVRAMFQHRLSTWSRYLPSIESPLLTPWEEKVW